MGRVNPYKTGLILGTLAGGWHVIWSLLVLTGSAQAVVNFVFWMHFLVAPLAVQPFHAGVAVVQVVVTTAAGYIVGFILGMLWNWIHA